jgi:hypothetical protein
MPEGYRSGAMMIGRRWLASLCTIGQTGRRHFPMVNLGSAEGLTMTPGLIWLVTAIVLGVMVGLWL